MTSAAAARDDDRPGPGELCVEGRLQGPLASNDAKFTVAVEVVEGVQVSRTWLPSVRPKVVMTNASTRYYINGELAQNVYYADDGRVFFHVRAIGLDHGAGQPLDARVVVLDKETETQRFLYEHLPASPPAVTEPDKPQPKIDIQTQTIKSSGQLFSLYVVSAKLSTVAVRCGLAQAQLGSTESLSSIANRYGALAAINGSYFDAYTSGPVKMPDMPLVTRGSLIYDSRIGTVLGFTADGRWRMDAAASIVRLCGSNCRMDERDDPERVLFWSHVTEAVGCGPRLVIDGVPKVSPYGEGFSDPEALATRTIRSAVGITADDRILLVVVHRAGLDDIARIMAALGCRQAMNLDGGSSSGLWYRGRSILSPGRNLSNALLITAR